MDIDKLFSASPEELDQILQTEVARVIEAAPEHKRERLWAIHNRARMQVRVAKNQNDAMLRTRDLMLKSFLELNEQLKILIAGLK